MIRLRNGYEFQFMASSGAFAFDGRGWLWEKFLISLGIIDPSSLTKVTKTVMRYPVSGNPYWRSICPIPGGAVNKVGLRGPGIFNWVEYEGPNLAKNVILSLSGEDACDLIGMLNLVRHREISILGVEFNSRYMAGDSSIFSTERIVNAVKLIDDLFPELPLILKVSYGQDYVSLAKKTDGRVDAISINSVPAECLTEAERNMCFRWYNGRDPMEKFGGGSISGSVAQVYQRRMIIDMVIAGIKTPIIGPGVRSYGDVKILEAVGSKAFSFGHVFLPFAPWWRPKRIMRKYLQNNN